MKDCFKRHAAGTKILFALCFVLGGTWSVSSLASSRSFSFSGPRENIDIVKGIFGKNIPEVDAQLQKAEQMSVDLYPANQELALDQCRVLEKKISQNYKFHVYEDMQSGQLVPGVQFCPEFQEKKGVVVFQNEWISAASIEITTADAKTNRLGVAGFKILSVSYRFADFPKVHQTQQYMFNKKFELVERVLIRTEDMPQGNKDFLFEVAALDSKGNVLRRIYKEWLNPKEEFLWKAASGFIAAKGDMVSGSRYIQNDDQGVEVSTTWYDMVHDMQWNNYEVSPLLAVHGLFGLDGKPVSVSHLYSYKLFTKPGLQCENGFDGYDASGDYIRVFGEDECQKKMGTSKSRY